MSLRELVAKAKLKGRKGRRLDVKEIRRIKRKGYKAERELVKKLRFHGFKSIRVPVSAPSNESLPDVFAVKGDCLLAFEVKAPKSGRAYFQRRQVAKLFNFLDIFEAYPRRIAVLCAKFPRKWVLKTVDKPDDYVICRDEESNIRLEKFT